MQSSGGNSRWNRLRTGWAVAVVAAALLLTGAACGRGGERTGDRAAPSATGTPPAVTTPIPSPTPEPGADLVGPLNFLLVGVDTRVSVPGWEPHSDAVLIMHIPSGLDRAYLFSIPRDLVLDIPAFPKARFSGDDRTKLTHAMSYGSRVNGSKSQHSTAQGFELLATTVSRYTGIRRFDAGAILTFGGLGNLVDTLGGVDLYIDQRVVSKHRRPDGRHRTLVDGEYVGPRMVYEKGQRHLNGWQAIDYARQRYTAGGDYTRQRHQQQLIKAIVTKVTQQDLARDPDRLGGVLRAFEKGFTFVGQGRQLIDFSFALSGLRPEAITTVVLPGRAVYSGGRYRGEQLDPIGREFIAELRAGHVEQFLAANPELVVRR